ncbi:uncharacterized protein LACBIDRAFT_333195 [Laccaria bicolor S238N-H82]|uniref:Predicted protein n=1 Tax=Laccaria bicolor (strain S238N-H82 / ATCC MYA-4686) TaxID=486041 RepID=B0DV72_LACBS|nr:uncharacterized protein LACBIDRAFT_333195 [Laccaria bicolor S238N-H82]EDR01461.1 predicted protein [Laccaria bicolor S238N-H82]|eukprot:XP_001887813.1 predicted protein [Laccaria bicolor S238N-H82]
MSYGRFRLPLPDHSTPQSQPLGTPSQPSTTFRWRSTPSSIRQRSMQSTPPPIRQRSIPALSAPAMSPPGKPFTPEPGLNFRLKATRYLLTYSQWAGVVEMHRDGHFHWHIICIFEKSPNVRFRSASRIFDVLHLHPNIRLLSRQGDVERAWDYIHKDPLSERFGPWSGPVDVVAQGLTSSRAGWAYILDAETAGDFTMRCTALDPKAYANNFSNLRIYMAHRYEKVQPRYISNYSHFPHLPQVVTDWVNYEMKKHERPKALIIWGPSRTGKTEWARSLGPHSYHNFQMNGSEFDENKASYIVLDDIDPASFPQYKCWLGAQREFTLNEKYCKKRRVVWGGPAIWLSNSNPLDYSSWDQNWLQANSVIVHLDHNLYDEGDSTF